MVNDPDLSLGFADPGDPVSLVTALVVVGGSVFDVVAEVLFGVREGGDGFIQVHPTRGTHKARIAEVPFCGSGVVEEVALVDLVPLHLRIALVALGEHHLGAADASDGTAPGDGGDRSCQSQPKA